MFWIRLWVFYFLLRDMQNGYGFIYSSMPYEVHIYCNVRRPSPDGGRVHAGERELEY